MAGLRTRACAAALLGLGSCSTYEPTFEWFDGLSVAHVGAAVGTVHPRSSEVSPAVGDQVAYELELSTPRSVRRWVMRLTAQEVPPPGAEGAVTFWVEVLDVAAQEAIGVEAELDVSHLRTGFFPAGEVMVDGTLVQGEVETVKSAVASILAVFSVIRESPPLAGILWQVVQAPSLWSVIVNFGVRIRVSLSQSESRRSELPGDSWDVPAYRVPMAVAINGNAGLHASVHVVEPRRPLSLGAGIVSLVAERPDGSGIRFRMRLVEATLGGGR